MLCGPALVAIAWAIALLDGGAVDAAVWRVPVQRHLVTARDASSYLHSEPLASWALGGVRSTKHASVWTPSFPEDPAHATEDIDFDSIVYGLYAADIMFGTPPQPISLVLSLGGSNLYVLNHKLGTHAYYDHTKSSTYQANGTQISMGEHTPYATQGFVSSDVITIPGIDCSHRDGLQVRGLSFVELVSPDSFLRNLPPRFDGCIGLGARTQNATGTLSIMQSMIAQGVLDEPIVGVHLDDKKAHLTFGGIDAQYKEEDITYFTDTREEPFGWWVPLTGIHVNGEAVVGKSGRALVADTLDFIAGPADQVDALADAVGAENYAIPCEGPGPDIQFTIGTFEVTLTKTDYAVPDKGACRFAFFPAPASIDHWMLGKPFVKRVYMVLDYGKVESDVRLGLAHLKPE